MATDVRPAPSAQATKYDAYIAAQLDKAQKRARLLDLTAAGLGFLAGTLAFALVMVLLDRLFTLSAGTRQLALAAYLVGSAVYLALFVLRPLTWRINPYYAARQLEKELPGAKNSVVNWIDLHEQKLPGVLHGAIGQRAAKDLARADVDRAISGRRTTYVGIAAAALGVLLATLFFILGPRPFVSFLGRAFAPFSSQPPRARTWIEMVRPREGNATITIGSPFTVVAEVGGWVPEASSVKAPRLLYRHVADEPWRDRFLQQDDSGREWATTLPPGDVGQGVWYKVAAGDAETPEYRVTVRATPLLTDFQVTYTYRPYVARVPRLSRDRKIEALRGTNLEIIIGANRPIKDATLELEGTDGTPSRLQGKPVAGKAQEQTFSFVLDRDGKYRVRFTTPEGESYVDGQRHDIVAILDEAPRVQLTEPAPKIDLPINGVLKVKGKASDDIGVQALTLRMQVVNGPKLLPQPYRPEKLRLPGGGHPRRIDYQDVVDLAGLQKEDKQPAGLAPGAEVEYWLEARDACDYPGPNVSESSPRHRVKLLPPTPEDKQKKDREAARKEQDKHEQEQDKNLNQQDRERQQERQDQKARNEEEKNKKSQKGQGGKSGQEDKPDTKGEKSKGGKEGADKRGKEGEKSDKDKQTENTGEKAKRAQEEHAKREQEEKEPGKGKGADQGEKAGKGKGTGEEKSGSEGDGDRKPAGQGRDGGKKNATDPPGKGKEEGSKGSSEGASSGKPDKQEGGAKEREKAAGKEGAQEGSNPKETKPGAGRSGEKKEEKKAEHGRGRSGGQPEERKEAGEAKPQGKASPEKEARPCEGKGAGDKTKPGEGKKQGTSKEGPEPMARPEGKDGEGADQPKDVGKGKPKGGAQTGKGRSAPRKPDASEGPRGEARANPEKKEGEGRDERAERELKERLDDLQKRLKDGDEKVRREAQKELDELKKAMREAEESQAGKGREKKAPPTGGGADGKPGECKDCQEGKGKGTAPGAGKEKGTEVKGQPEGKGKGAGKEEGPPGAEEKVEPGKGKKAPGTSPGMGGAKGLRRTGEHTANKPHEAEKPREHRASMMQLEKFKKMGPEELKGLKMSPEEWQKFLKDYEALAKRNEARAGRDEVVPGLQRGGNLPTIGGGKLPAGKGRPDVKSDGRGKAPPGYRDAYAEFLRQLARPAD